MSGAVDDKEEQIICLENVLTINPYNEQARRGLAVLQATPATAVAPAGPAPGTIPPSPRAAMPAHLESLESQGPPGRPYVEDFRIYITIVIFLSLLLVCLVASVVTFVALTG